MIYFRNVILSITFLLLGFSPALAFAASSVSWDSATSPVSSDPTYTVHVDSGDAVILYRPDGCSNAACNDRIYEGVGWPSGTLSSITSDYGISIAPYNGTEGNVVTLAVVHPYNGTSAPLCNTLASCVTNGYVVQQSSITFTDLGPVTPIPPQVFSTTTIPYVNPNQDIFMIVVAFMYSMWFAIWLFRKRN